MNALVYQWSLIPGVPKQACADSSLNKSWSIFRPSLSTLRAHTPQSIHVGLLSTRPPTVPLWWCQRPWARCSCRKGLELKDPLNWAVISAGTDDGSTPDHRICASKFPRGHCTTVMSKRWSRLCLWLLWCVWHYKMHNYDSEIWLMHGKTVNKYTHKMHNNDQKKSLLSKNKEKIESSLYTF